MVERIGEILGFAETIVIGNGDKEFCGVVDRLREGQVIVDLVRITASQSVVGKYDGICW